MKDRGRPFGFQSRFDECGVADVAFDEACPGGHAGLEVLELAAAQVVDHDDLVATSSEGVDEV